MINAMSEKLLVISQKDAQKFGLVKLFTRDVDEIDAAAHAFHDIWASVLELAFGIYTATSISGCSAYMAIFCPLGKASFLTSIHAAMLFKPIL